MIISYAATLLGPSSKCFATDINPVALEVAVRTASVYGVDAHIVPSFVAEKPPLFLLLLLLLLFLAFD